MTIPDTRSCLRLITSLSWNRCSGTILLYNEYNYIAMHALAMLLVVCYNRGTYKRGNSLIKPAFTPISYHINFLFRM